MRSEFASISIAIERNESMHGGIPDRRATAVWGLFHECCNTLLDDQKQGCPDLESGHGTPYDWLLPSFSLTRIGIRAYNGRSLMLAERLGVLEAWLAVEIAARAEHERALGLETAAAQTVDARQAVVFVTAYPG